MSEIIFSCVIPCRDLNDPKLKDLIASIRSQDFPQDQIEILAITEGDSEQAKAIGIRKAKGEICAMFCADNRITRTGTFNMVYETFKLFGDQLVGFYSKHYSYSKKDNSLNRYFSLIGNNDPIAFYLGKCDRQPRWADNEDEVGTIFDFKESVPSLGDNGFFFRRDCLLLSNIDNYYPMDIAEDLRKVGLKKYFRLELDYIWHRTTDGNLIEFLKRRYRYARDLYSDRQDRRWRMVDTKEDKLRLYWFIISTVTVFPALAISIKGFLKIRDFAWFWHPIVALSFLITYGILALRNWIKYGSLFQCRQPQLSSRHLAEAKV